MKQKNLKIFTSLGVVTLFVIALLVGSSSNKNITSPAKAALPPVTTTTISTPTIVERNSAVLNWSSVTGATGYVVQFFPVINGKVATVPSITRTTTTTNYSVVSGDNITDNAVYGWNVTATNKTTRSVPSANQYFKITPAVSTQKAGSVLIYNFFASSTDGSVYRYDPIALKWNNISGSVTTKTTAPTVAPVQTTTAVGRVITAVTTAISNAVTATVNFFRNLVGLSPIQPAVSGDGFYTQNGTPVNLDPKNPSTNKTKACCADCVEPYACPGSYCGYYYCNKACGCGTFQ